MTEREALKLALEALERGETKLRYEAITAIKEALAQPEPEYLAFMDTPQRTWVGLTDEEIWETISRIGTSDSNVNPYAKLADARAIEAKLKEKNGL